MWPDPSTLLNQQYNSAGIMTAEWQCQMIASWLNEWANPRGGTVKVKANPSHFWEEIYVVDETPRILIVCNGEVARGGFEQANTKHRVDRQWLVAVIRGHGFNPLISEGQGQPNTPAAIDPFLKDVQVIRDGLRQLTNISEEPPIDYKGFDPMPSVVPYGPKGNVFADGYAIKFSTANDIPAISDVSGQTVPAPPLVVINGMVQAIVQDSGAVTWQATDQATGVPGVVEIRNGLAVFIPS